MLKVMTEVVTVENKTTIRYVFASTTAPISTSYWNQKLKPICSKNEMLNNCVFDNAAKMFKIQVKTIVDVESAIALCDGNSNFPNDIYVNGENFSFKYYYHLRKETIGGKVYTVAGEIAVPKP